MASPFKDDQPLDVPYSAGSRDLQKARGNDKPDSEGDALLSAGRFEEAVAAFRTSLGRDVSRAEGVYLKRRMAVALQSLARWEDATACLDEAREEAVRAGLLSEEAQLLVEY